MHQSLDSFLRRESYGSNFNKPYFQIEHFIMNLVVNLKENYLEFNFKARILYFEYTLDIYLKLNS